MTEKICLQEVVVVEGRYDAGVLSGLVNALVLPTDGFSIFTDEEKKALLCKLGRERGVLILTDSDAAGFRIRHYVEKIAAGCKISHAYIPAIPGKERRKRELSKEGLLGVEGMTQAQLRTALQNAGLQESEQFEKGEKLSYHDLYELGISGGEGSAQRRRALLQKAKLPLRLSKKALREVLSALYTKEELEMMLKPVLFWDFHATLTTPDVVWFDAVMELAADLAPEIPLTQETLKEHFGRKCLPWFSIESGDTRHIKGSKAWWAYCEKQFVSMLQKCGFPNEQAGIIAVGVRKKVLEVWRYTLYPDAVPTLKTLCDRGYRHFMLSNNFPELGALVKEMGIADYFEDIIVSGEVGYDKPHIEIYEFARKAAGNPAECYMIGDSVRDDIQGGRAAGFVTVWVHPKPGQSAQAHHEFQSLEELTGLFL